MKPDDFVRPMIAWAWDYPAGHHLEPHEHPGGQLDYAVSGVMTVTTPEGIWVLPPQRALWIPPGVRHDGQMAGPVAMRTIYVSPALAARLPPRCAVVSVSPLLRELILAAMDAPPHYDDGGPDDRLFAVLLDQIRTAEAMPVHLAEPRDPQLRALAASLRADPADTRTLHACAKSAGMSARTFARAFLRETGMTFGAWRQQLRLLEAMRLLSAGTPVTEVGLRTGYESTSAFIAMFRRAMGEPPGRFFSGLREGVSRPAAARPGPPPSPPGR
ncbi:MAG: helix-turn-helix transcriptional regulator [Dehalococcoidia bacterium]